MKRFILATAMLVAAGADAQQARPKRPPTNGGLPSVSPDGKWIAFIRNGEGVVPGLYVIGVDGGGERRLGDAPQAAPAWLPDGSGVYYGVGEFNADSTDVRARKLDGAESLIQRIPARDAVLTRDMKGIYAAAGKFPNFGLVHIPVGTKEVHPLTNKPGMIFNIAVNASEKVVFTHADSARNMQIYTLAPGNQFKALTSFTADEGRPQWPSWSPDGRWIAVQAGKYDRNDPTKNSAHIWLVDTQTGESKKLAAHEKPYLDETPSFFPDGKRIAFQSDRSGRMEIWVMNVDGTGARQVTR
jgi:Tol biopolymer transport system component